MAATEDGEFLIHLAPYAKFDAPSAPPNAKGRSPMDFAAVYERWQKKMSASEGSVVSIWNIRENRLCLQLHRGGPASSKLRHNVFVTPDNSVLIVDYHIHVMDWVR